MMPIKILVVTLCSIWTFVGYAQGFPSKSIKLVVPYSAGGGSDFVARLIGSKLTESLGQPIVIENRPGAGGLIGAEYAAQAPADGYTLLLADSSFTISPIVNKKSSYDATKDFESIGLLADTPYVFITSTSDASPKNLNELITLAKGEPGKLSIGNAGNGSGSHLASELFQLTAAIKMIPIPYKSSGQVTMETMSGQVYSSFATAPSVVQNYKTGKIKILAAASKERTSTLPDVPVFSEFGYKDVVITNWYGLLAPARTPAKVIDLLSQEIARIVALPDVREKLNSAALEPRPSTSQQFKELIASELVKWRAVVQQAKIEIE